MAIFDNKLIGTHDSVTGEDSFNFWHSLITPFSKTQDKTIQEQLEAGVTYFDLRFKYKKGIFYCAHGTWTSNRTLISVLEQIERWAWTNDRKIFVSLTYEGKYPYTDGTLAKTCEGFIESLPHKDVVIPTFISIKLPKWRTIVWPILTYAAKHKDGIEYGRADNCFAHMDGWKLLIPIPRFWKKYCFNKVEFNNKYWKLVDFL